MDLVDFDQAVYDRICADYLTFAEQLAIPDIRFVPISALRGDNVVTPSTRAPWYEGPTLMSLLETVELDRDVHLDAFRLPVQYVNRPNLDFRGFCGTVASGEVKPGDTIVALPSGKHSRVKSVVSYEGEQPRGFAGQAITLTLEDEIDISRGDLIVKVNETHPNVSTTLDAHIVWMNEQPLLAGKEYAFKLAGKQVYGRIERILHRVDVNSLAESDAAELALNEIGLCRVVLNAPVVFDAYRECRGTGSFIVIDRLSNATAGAGMVVASAVADTGMADANELARLRGFELEFNALVRKYFPHWEARDIRDLLGR
jgi:sulfate adenylyltransferase subunit 1